MYAENGEEGMRFEIKEDGLELSQNGYSYRSILIRFDQLDKLQAAIIFTKKIREEQK